MEDFELISRITDEISMFLDDIGVDPGACSYDYNFDSELRRYTAVVALRSPVDEDILEEFNENQYEFADHMDAAFPGTTVSLTVTVEDSGYGAGYASLDSMDSSAEDYLLDDSDSYSDDIDSAERQYAEEGLTIVCEGDDDEDYVMLPDDPDGDDDDEGSEDDDSELDYLDELESDETDGYTPSAEDMEELWSAFGVSEDE